eukprot:8110923-Heterocapsa_arctica.AAC.1
MADLSARVRHTHSPYCGFAREGACRFGFPQPMAPNARPKTSKESFASQSKNHFFARRRPGAGYMGLYNSVLLRRWRASMDLQFVRDGYAATKYILGYVLKSDTDKASQLRFEEFIKSQMESTDVDRHAVYKAAHVALQGRVTSVNEACHLVLGLPTVMVSRGSSWIPVGDPSTWSMPVERKREGEVLRAAQHGTTDCLPELTMPAALKAYAARPMEGGTTLPVEGSATRAEVLWQDLTLFDFIAG